MATSKRIDGATPHGGIYTLATFRDEDLQPVEKEKASVVELVEYDAEDQPLFHTFLPLVNEAGKEPSSDD